MTKRSRFGDLLFWFMVLLGGAILAPCLILPPWLEYQASLDLKALRTAQVARREAELTTLRKQREHLETDDAYVLRLAREQLNIETPGTERIPVERRALPTAPAIDPPDSASTTAEDELAPELSALVEQALQRYPVAKMFVRPETRPSLLFIGSGLILTAVLLLGTPAALRHPRSHPPAD